MVEVTKVILGRMDVEALKKAFVALSSNLAFSKTMSKTKAAKEAIKTAKDRLSDPATGDI